MEKCNNQMNRACGTHSKIQARKGRRELLRWLQMSLLGILLTQKAEGVEANQSEFKVLDENDQLDIDDRGKEIIEKAYRFGYDFEKKHKGCCRCAVAALQNAIDFIPKDKDLFRSASCLDGGATPTGLQNCGAFTGAGMVIGWICGSEKFESTRLSHKLIRKVYQQFEKEYGSVLCKDVKEKMSSNCPEVVGRAARWTADVLLRQFTNYEMKDS